MYVDGEPAKRLRLRRASGDGISYAHFISTARKEDSAGMLVESVRAEVG